MRTLLWPLPGNVLKSLPAHYRIPTSGTHMGPSPCHRCSGDGLLPPCHPVSQELVFSAPRFIVSLAPHSVSQATAIINRGPYLQNELRNSLLPFQRQALFFPKTLRSRISLSIGRWSRTQIDREEKSSCSLYNQDTNIGWKIQHTLWCLTLIPSALTFMCCQRQLTAKSITLQELLVWSRSTWPVQQQPEVHHKVWPPQQHSFHCAWTRS